MDFLICEPQGRRGVIRPHGALVVLKRYVRFWYFPHWVYTWISLVWGPAYFSWLVYYTTDMQITASLAGREAWFHFFICPLNFFCVGEYCNYPWGVCRARWRVWCVVRRGGRVLGAAEGVLGGVVWGAVGVGAGGRGGGAGGWWCGVPWGRVLGAAEGVLGGVVWGAVGGGRWEPRRGCWAWWCGVPWGRVLGAAEGVLGVVVGVLRGWVLGAAVGGVVRGAVGVGAGSRGGGGWWGGVAFRGGGCWGLCWARWRVWCEAPWGWVLGAVAGQIKLVQSPPLLLICMFAHKTCLTHAFAAQQPFGIYSLNFVFIHIVVSVTVLTDCIEAMKWGFACCGPHKNSVYSVIEPKYLDSPWLIKRAMGIPKPWRALISWN